MPVFEYSAFDIKGKRISGIVDAESAVSARQKLRSSQVYPVSVDEVSGIPRKAEIGFPPPGIFHRIRAPELAVMTRELAVLVGAGFPLAAALETLVFQTRLQPMKKLLAKIKDLVVEGNSFSEALSRFPAVFSPLYINMVHAGESSGTLEIVLDRLAEMTEKHEDLKGKIRVALTYPVFMAVLGTAVLFFLLTVIIPDIAKIFEDMGRNLPAPTRFLIFMSSIFKSFWWLMLFMISLAFFSAHRFKST
ncbi:MAG: type II secretion system F family protein, partial [Thermodesulfobacteriota bacterium]